ncbi:hypothetical protein [Azotosporobacter soli]|uniref:hypothetical protein n=1 Tax=Azotosporobacter soli TaxID=3055040 RepID=UPI0031FF4214
MSGQRGIKHFGEHIILDVLKMKEEGKTNREISEFYGFKDKYVIKELIRRHNRKQKMIESGIIPRKKGRPPKSYVTIQDKRDNEIKRLKMENELLRSFLQIVGRK